MRLIVGLGNPGERYKNTRHNVGFMLVDALASTKNASWSFEKKFHADIAKTGNTIFVKPQTFMNNSGESVSKITAYYNIDLKDITVIHDDVDLALGESKKQFGVGAAGHKGVQSILDHLGSKELCRIRIGVGRPQDSRVEVEDWVLSAFDDEDVDSIYEMFEEDGLGI